MPKCDGTSSRGLICVIVFVLVVADAGLEQESAGPVRKESGSRSVLVSASAGSSIRQRDHTPAAVTGAHILCLTLHRIVELTAVPDADVFGLACVEHIASSRSQR